MAHGIPVWICPPQAMPDGEISRYGANASQGDG